MHRVSINLPLYLPSWLYRRLRKLKRGSREVEAGSATRLNLLGDRDIEWSWIASQIPRGAGEALDFGSGGSHLALIAAERGFNVTGVDLEPIHCYYRHPRLNFLQGDILHLPLPGHFDLVINCSTVEHVGLAGRYGTKTHRADGDLEAMQRLKGLIKPNGMMLLTIPVGQDGVFSPSCRVYGEQRLPDLLSGYSVEEQRFWVKDKENCWVQCDADSAMGFQPSIVSCHALENVYALGGFVLRKSQP